MKYHIKIKKAFNVIGFELKTTSKRAEVEIGQLWHKFIAERWEDKIPTITHIEPLAVYYDYHGKGMCCPMGPDSYACLIGCQVEKLDEIPVGMTGKAVPEQKYAVFTVTGEFPESLINAWKEINGMKELERTFLYDFESYKHFREPSQEVDVYVGVK